MTSLSSLTWSKDEDGRHSNRVIMLFYLHNGPHVYKFTFNGYWIILWFYCKLFSEDFGFGSVTPWGPQTPIRDSLEDDAVQKCDSDLGIMCMYDPL